MKKLLFIMMVCLLTLQMNFLTEGRLSFAAVNTSERAPNDSIRYARGPNVHKIISALEDRMSDQPLLEKVKHKVFTLSDQHTRVIASLSEHVVQERKSTSGDIAFLLLTTLIILL